MTLRSRIDTAKAAISEALIAALQDKNETAVNDLFDAYNKVVQIKITETNKSLFTIDTGYDGYHYHDGYINFGNVGVVPGAAGTDTISFTTTGLG